MMRGTGFQIRRVRSVTARAACFWVASILLMSTGSSAGIGAVEAAGVVDPASVVEVVGTVDPASAVGPAGKVEVVGTVDPASAVEAVGTVNPAGVVGPAGKVEAVGTVNSAGVVVAASAVDPAGVVVAASAVDESSHSRTVLYYFHRTLRCDACLQVEALLATTIETHFADELQSGELIWLPRNLDDPEHEHFETVFSLQFNSAVLTRLRGEEITGWKNLEGVWDLLDQEEEFLEYVELEIATALAAADTVAPVPAAPAPVAPDTVAPVPAAPAPVAPDTVAPVPAASAPVAPVPAASAPVAPDTVAPVPAAPAPVAPVPGT